MKFKQKIVCFPIEHAIFNFLQYIKSTYLLGVITCSGTKIAYIKCYKIN